MIKRWSFGGACQTIRRWNDSIQVSSSMTDYKTGSNKNSSLFLFCALPTIYPASNSGGVQEELQEMFQMHNDFVYPKK